jgi:hypothetical protein
MGRFDRDNPESEQAQVAAATEKLRSTVEGQVRQVVEEAMARAFAIEDRALSKANEMQIESQRRASDALEASIGRAEGMLEAIETLQTELVKVIVSFKDEMEALRSELSDAKEGLSPEQIEEPAGSRIAIDPRPPMEDVPAPAPPPSFVPEPDSAVEPDEHGDPTTTETPNPPPVAPSNPVLDADNGSREAIRHQLTRLRDAGKPREDAERYLVRFKQPDSYRPLLDELYGQAADQPPARRRRGLLRRK